jgi:hypothetical protein
MDTHPVEIKQVLLQEGQAILKVELEQCILVLLHECNGESKDCLDALSKDGIEDPVDELERETVGAAEKVLVRMSRRDAERPFSRPHNTEEN